jgi:hypothetical protein
MSAQAIITHHMLPGNFCGRTQRNQATKPDNAPTTVETMMFQASRSGSVTHLSAGIAAFRH